MTIDPKALEAAGEAVFERLEQGGPLPDIDLARVAIETYLAAAWMPPLGTLNASQTPTDLQSSPEMQVGDDNA